MRFRNQSRTRTDVHERGTVLFWARMHAIAPLYLDQQVEAVVATAEPLAKSPGRAENVLRWLRILEGILL
jgi:hypothetical protein